MQEGKRLNVIFRVETEMEQAGSKNEQFKTGSAGFLEVVESKPDP